MNPTSDPFNKPFPVEILSTKTRIDGRKFDELRELKYSFPSRRGVVIVQRGKTIVTAAASYQLVVVGEDVTRGSVRIRAPKFSMMDPTPEHELCRHVLNESFRSSGALNLDTLSATKGRAFQITVDTEVIADDGGVLDTAICAVGAALSHMMLPAVDIEDGKVVVFSPQQREPKSVTLNHLPIAITYAQMDTALTGAPPSFVHVADPSRAEVLCCAGMVTVLVNKSGEMVGLYRLRGKALGHRTIEDLAVKVNAAVGQVSNDLETAVGTDVEKRMEKWMEWLKTRGDRAE
eukprot:gnl/Dysnectes_brevis/2468_a2951_1359.p2 GENE.gnl/Dysnectes_brevis/2468_a2951_1359~~gnl/Dysnectes_brevis/2468_a2951_1359.p2  ORF type:complete len:290 (+),score=96.46 gnl/Dysnectes_brevis/2468_a2951_1359:126-995(+)